MSDTHLDPDDLSELVQEHFAFLEVEFGLIPSESRTASARVITYAGLHHAVRVSIAANGGSYDIEVANPDEAPPAPVVGLGDIVAMRAPGTARPSRATGSREEARESLSKSGELLRQLADDALWGGWGLFEDFLHWRKRGALATSGVDWWLTPPFNDPGFHRGRTKAQIRIDREYQPVHGQLRLDPEAAWPGVIEFVRRHPATLEASDLIEDLIFEHGERFIDRIEELALTDNAFRSTVAHAYVGGIAGRSIDRFHRLQDELNAGE